MKINKQRGIVRTIVLIIIALLVISYFGINLRQLASSPTTESNFSYVWNGTVYVWDTYLKTPVTEAYHFFVTYIWTPAINDIQKIDMNQPTSGEQNMNPNAYPTAPATH